MLYLSGCVSPALPPEVGVMVTPMMGNLLPPDRTWAADTGCFARPEAYRDAKYLNWLADRRDHAERCLFAAAPDVWGDGRATLRLAAPMLRLIRLVGFRSALVLQPGIRSADIPWDDLDAVFVGGVDEWQNGPTVQAIVDEAKARGKWAHRGRVNSRRRLLQSRARGFDSADGTFAAFGPDKNIPRLAGWLDALKRQPPLPLEGACA